MTDKEWSEFYKRMKKHREKMRDNPEWRARRLKLLMNVNFSSNEKHIVSLKIDQDHDR